MTTTSGAVRWGIIGTANIARSAFLPGLRAAGQIPAAVAARDGARAEKFAAEQGIGQAVAGYEQLLSDPQIDAVYIPLPNALHAEWTIRALQAGRPVLCEKPLCGTLADTERVLAAARETGTLLWEAFVFPFHDQMRLVRSLLADGVIGELREIQSDFHFALRSPANIRLSAGLEGGALRDVGCYPVRLAQELLGEHASAWAVSEPGGGGVDIETIGSLGYPGGRRLLLSCGLRRPADTLTRLLGSAGQIHLTNPFHPRPTDRLTVYRGDGTVSVFPAAGAAPSFSAAIAHISAAITGAEPPRFLAVDTSLPTARALHDLAAAARY
ncbi:MAG: Gfo/Idh/MocA family protein [Streptosporangiaceae bacterium]